MYQWQCSAVRQIRYVRELINHSQNSSIAFYSSDTPKETDGNVSHLENKRIKRVKLSPMSRITEMLSNDQGTKEAPKNLNETINRQSDDAKASKENNSSYRNSRK